MAEGDLTKDSEYDKIEVVQRWNIQVRQKTMIKEEQADGSKKVINHSFKRHILIPYDSKWDGSDWTHTDTDISGEDAKVKAIANIAWDSDTKAAYKTWRESRPYGNYK